MKLLALLLALAAVSPLRSQTLELRGGDSSLLNASGGSATLFMPNATFDLSAGIAGGRLVAGADSKFDFQNWNAVAGDQQLYLTTGQAGLAIPLRGFSISKKNARRKLLLYAGLTGNAYTAPFFSGTRAATPSAGLEYSFTAAHGFAFSSVENFAGSKLTALQEADWIARALRVTINGGALQNKFFLSGLADGRWRHFGANVGHQAYFFRALTSEVNSAGVATSFGPVFGSASAFRSTQASGEAANIGIQLGESQAQLQELFSRYGRTTMISLTEHLARRFHVSEYVTRSQGKTSINFGGGYASNRGSIDVSYQQQFLPFGNVPFSKALVLQLSFHAHGVNVNTGTLSGPDGKTRFTAYGDSYLQTGLQTAPGQPQGRGVGGVLYTGEVRDLAGAPVAGAAVQVGQQECWTDADGHFEATTRRAETLTISVLLDEFTAPGKWTLISAPEKIVPGSPAAIVVSR